MKIKISIVTDSKHLTGTGLFGGRVTPSRPPSSIGNNIKSVTQLLKEKNIPICASVLGGTGRKSVFLDVEFASIFYIEGDSPKKLLWEPLEVTAI